MNSKEEEEYFKRLGIKIRFLRELNGLSQINFALKCGLGNSEIWKVEMGYINPRLETIARIAKGFEITIDKLLKIE